VFGLRVDSPTAVQAALRQVLTRSSRVMTPTAETMSLNKRIKSRHGVLRKYAVLSGVDTVREDLGRGQEKKSRDLILAYQGLPVLVNVLFLITLNIPS